MKNILKLSIIFALFLEIANAANDPRGMADVIGRSMSSSAGSWLARFGHVALYDSSRKDVLQVSNKYPAIERANTTKMTRPSTGQRHYWGASYGIGSTSQHYRVLSSGVAQQAYRPQYTYSPYYTEGKWTKKWKFSWSKGWYKAWTKQRAKFRCDSFVNYCYTKATGHRLVYSTWTTTPTKVWTRLPYRR